MGGGGEGGRLPRTKAIEGAGEGDREAAFRSNWAAILSRARSSLRARGERGRAAAGAGMSGSMGSGVEGR